MKRISAAIATLSCAAAALAYAAMNAYHAVAHFLGLPCW
jgi:hypothetical protein